MEPAKLIRCSHDENDEHPTPVRVSTLKEMFERLPGSSPYNDQIAFACPHCSHVALAHVARESHLSDIADQAEPFGGIAEFAIALECADNNCLSRVQVLAPMKPGTDESQARAQVLGWTDSGLTCAEGHPLSNPLQIGHVRKW
jgi:hypothetical protein